MKRLLYLLATGLLSGAPLAAQEPVPARDMRRDVSPGVVTPTQEMWFYEQERNRSDDPKMAVRRKAEFRAAQRSNRLASMHWYGMSNSRPVVNTTPWFGSFSPTWVSNSSDPNFWRPLSQTSIVVVPGRPY